MSKKPMRSSLYQRQLNGDGWFHFYQRSLRNLVYQMFKWEGLPETVNTTYLEKTLHRDGLIAFYDDPRQKHMCVSGAPMYLNPYNQPTTFRSAMYMYQKEFQLYTPLLGIDVGKSENVGVLCTNQIGDYASSEQAIYMFAALLAENKQTKMISQNALKIPYVFSVKPEQALAVKNIFEKIQANEPLIIEDEEQSLLESFKILNTNAPFLLDKIQADQMEIYNEFLTYFGINNVNIQKKERTNLSEVNSNNELIIHNRNKFLAPREETARILSQLWGMEITVGLRDNLSLDVHSVGNSLKSKVGEEDG